MGLTKIKGGKRIHIIMDEDTVYGLDWLAANRYQFNRSKAIRDLVSKAVDKLQRQGKRAVSRVARSRTR